jgi:protein TonB
MPPEPDDPAVVIPYGAVPFFPSESRTESTVADIRNAPAPPTDTAAQTDFRKTPESKRKWPAAVVASCLLHAAAALAFLSVPGSMIDPTDLADIEGMDQTGDMVAGNAAEDQVSAGDVTNVTLIPVVRAKPVETIGAQPVTPAEAIQPVEEAAAEAPPSETIEPVREEKAVAETAPSAKPVPDILAVQPADSENTAAHPVKSKSAQTVKPSVAPPQDSETAAQPRKKAERRPEKPHEAPAKKPVRQARKKPTPGSGGANASDSKQGVADGRDSGKATLFSRGGAGSGIGNAAVSNYPGKVAAKLQRSARNISRAARREAHNNAQVSFIVTQNGGVASVRLVRSSGSSDLDKTAMAIIRRAAPFPPIPPEAHRATWAFTLPIGPF